MTTNASDHVHLLLDGNEEIPAKFETGSSAGTPPSRRKQAFDYKLLLQLFSIIRIVHQRVYDFLWLTGLIVVAGSKLYVVSLTGTIIGGFYDIIVTQNSESFRDLLWKAMLIQIFAAVLESAVKVISSIIAWRWRRNLVQRLHADYFADRAYYKLINFDTSLDNPDQRITQDVDNFTAKIAEFAADMLVMPFQIVFYTVKTWQTIAWYGPAIVFSYFLVSYVINKLIMSPVVALVYKQEKLEGDFRFNHVRIRTSSESVAFYGGEEADRSVSESYFKRVMENKWSLIRWDGFLTLTSNTFVYIGSVMTYVVVALPFLMGASEGHSSAGYVADASFQVIMLIHTFSQINNFSVKISDMAGFAARIGQMLDTTAALKSNDSTHPSYNGKIQFSDDESIEFDKVTTFSPKGISLVQALSFHLPRGKSLLIMGSSGSGKTSQLRALASLWPFFEGVIRVPYSNSKADFLYLPQSSYLPYGTLEDQLAYPLKTTSIGAARLAQHNITPLLRVVGLERLVTPALLSTPQNWAEVLSPGEQQRLSMARVLFHRPKVVVLDEATACVESAMEEAFYKALATPEWTPTIISVGHRESLRKFHDGLIELQPQGRWRTEPLR